jgi:hypothetical protein
MPVSQAVLSALRSQAQAIIARASSRVERDRLRRQYADHVLINRARLLMQRLEQTSNQSKRRQILRQALLGA